MSSDLTGAFTNAWYTTVDRDPFEWSYDANPDPMVQAFVGSWLQNDTLGVLVSGPRWRLKPNKYGQDLPGLEIAIDALPGFGTNGADCYAPPFDKALIKYPVGEPTITEINLLDWETATTSPLAFSRGWVDVTQNGFVEVVDTNNGVPYTTNGLPMTDDFDLAVYIKGDRKATAVYDAWLEIDYDATPVLDVPNVIGLIGGKAVAAIQTAGLTVGTITRVSDPAPAREVIDQAPLACTACASPGDPVDLVISLGQVTDIPNVVGLTGGQAVTALEAAGLRVRITRVNDPVVPARFVISQNPTACTACATTGDIVDIVISLGPSS